MNKSENILKKYSDYVDLNYIDVDSVAYCKKNEYTKSLNVLDSLNTGIIVVFDYIENNYFYLSDNIRTIGFEPDFLNSNFIRWFRTRLHPNDYIINLAGIKSREFIANTKDKKWDNYKLTSDFRILNKNDEYVRLIAQTKVLESDKYGNPWLVLNIIDYSPVQDLISPCKSTFVDTVDNLVIFSLESDNHSHACISAREKDVLKLVADGMRSKEIAEELNISSNTVNNHRRNIMDKLHASNTAELIQRALKMNIL